MTDTNRDRSVSAGDDAARLRELRELLLERHAFKPGDLVTWKRGLQNKRRPREGEPAIVIEVLEKAIFDENEKPDSAYFREPLDVIIGLLSLEERTLVTYYADSRRLMLFEAV